MEPPPALPDHPRVKTGGVNPGHWGCFHSYSRATYQKLEVEEQDRRSIPIDDNLFEHDLPWGGETEAGETRGWFSHWRRGVGPTLRGWAKGSKGAVVHMLVVSAQKFGVEDEVGAAPLQRVPCATAPAPPPHDCIRVRVEREAARRPDDAALPQPHHEVLHGPLDTRARAA